MDLKVVFCTHAGDELYDIIGTGKLINSAKYFHPDIPFVNFGTKEINKCFSDHGVDWKTIHPFISYPLLEQYDLVVHFDADCMITAPLTEILEGDYDVAGVRNNDDYGVRKGKMGIHDHHWLNAGCVACRSKEFYSEWCSLNKSMARHVPDEEQGILNHLFWKGKYKNKLLDPKDKMVYYGLSNVYSTYDNKIPMPDWIKKSYNMNHWESWKNIREINNQLILDNKVVKILHQAGGFNTYNSKKLTWEMFDPSIIPFLTKITGYES